MGLNDTDLDHSSESEDDFYDAMSNAEGENVTMDSEKNSNSTVQHGFSSSRPRYDGAGWGADVEDEEFKEPEQDVDSENEAEKENHAALPRSSDIPNSSVEEPMDAIHDDSGKYLNSLVPTPSMDSFTSAKKEGSSMPAKTPAKASEESHESAQPGLMGPSAMVEDENGQDQWILHKTSSSPLSSLISNFPVPPGEISLRGWKNFTRNFSAHEQQTTGRLQIPRKPLAERLKASQKKSHSIGHGLNAQTEHKYIPNRSESSSSYYALFPPPVKHALPAFLKAQVWSPDQSSSRSTSRSSGTNVKPFEKKQLRSIYICHETLESLIRTYRSWPVGKEMPMQLSNLWGNKVVDGNRLEDPPFESPLEQIKLDLYHWTSGSGVPSCGWVDHQVLIGFLFEPERYPAFTEDQALQFRYVDTLFIDTLVLDRLVEFCGDATFLERFPGLQRLFVNIEGVHFGPCPGFEAPMGFTLLTENSELSIDVQNKITKLLHTVSERYPQWLAPSLTLVQPDPEAVSHSQSSNLEEPRSQPGLCCFSATSVPLYRNVSRPVEQDQYRGPFREGQLSWPPHEKSVQVENESTHDKEPYSLDHPLVQSYTQTLRSQSGFNEPGGSFNGNELKVQKRRVVLKKQGPLMTGQDEEEALTKPVAEEAADDESEFGAPSPGDLSRTTSENIKSRSWISRSASRLLPNRSSSQRSFMNSNFMSSKTSLFEVLRTKPLIGRMKVRQESKSYSHLSSAMSEDEEAYEAGHVPSVSSIGDAESTHQSEAELPSGPKKVVDATPARPRSNSSATTTPSLTSLRTLYNEEEPRDDKEHEQKDAKPRRNGLTRFLGRKN